MSRSGCRLVLFKSPSVTFVVWATGPLFTVAMLQMIFFFFFQRRRTSQCQPLPSHPHPANSEQSKTLESCFGEIGLSQPNNYLYSSAQYFGFIYALFNRYDSADMIQLTSESKSSLSPVSRASWLWHFGLVFLCLQSYKWTFAQIFFETNMLTSARWTGLWQKNPTQLTDWH